MVFGLLRRAFGLGCFLLVAYAATVVPLGRRTALGHLQAIFTTQPAHEAAEDIESLARGALSRNRPAPPPDELRKNP